MKICASLPGGSKRQILNQIKKANTGADLIELRLDSIKNPELELLLNACKKETIVTFRSKNEGGKNTITKREGVALLKKALELNADFVDIELSLGKNKINEIMEKKKRSKIILSHHNTKKTPEIKKLGELACKMTSFNPDIIKIVCRANNFKDNLRMINFLSRSSEKSKMICFCMGENSRISRISAPIIGNPIMFVSLTKGSETAKGQLTINEAKEIRGKIQ